MSINIRSCYKINSIVILSRTKWINKSKKDIQEILIRYFSSILVYFHLVKQDCRIWFLIFNFGELSEIQYEFFDLAGIYTDIFRKQKNPLTTRYWIQLICLVYGLLVGKSGHYEPTAYICVALMEKECDVC